MGPARVRFRFKLFAIESIATNRARFFYIPYHVKIKLAILGLVTLQTVG